MQLGEIIFGGVGSGLYGMIVFVIIAIFVAGLMVGRTPEYLGKKIEAKEVKMAMLAILCLPLVMLGGTAVALAVPSAVAAMNNAGPHGLLRGSLRLHVRGGQQRLRFRRPFGQYDVLQRHARHRHADRALLRDRPGDGDRRLARRQEDRARLGRHLPDDGAAVRRPARRRDPDRGWPHLLPRPGAGADRRAPSRWSRSRPSERCSCQRRPRDAASGPDRLSSGRPDRAGAYPENIHGPLQILHLRSRAGGPGRSAAQSASSTRASSTPTP